MRRGIVLLLGGLLALTMAAPAAAAAEECHEFGAEWKVCYWLLEPNPSGGRLYHVVICEGAMCIVVSEPERA